ncbi:MAG: hypothetical protein IJ642_01240 [Oscillospiraceae bacterium]|nr:hypothetical protein [Oscillospiraceae bacterium]
MTIPELFQNYYFHDSIFIKSGIYKKDGNFAVWCQFCDFLQKNYQSSQPANSDILILFHHAQFSGHVADCSVLEQKLIDDRTICFFLENWNGSEFLDFSVSADSVEIQVIRKYNL